MKPSHLRILLAGTWLASVAVAFYFGKQSGGGSDPAASEKGGSPSVVMNTPGGISASPGSSDATGGSASPGSGDAADDGDEGADVRALISKIRSQLGGGSGMMYNPTAMMKAMAPMADLTEDEVHEALEEVTETVRNQQQKMMFYSLLLGRLAETDGAGAMAFVEEHLSEEGGMAMGVTYSVVGTWAQRDPDATWEWYLANREKDNPIGAMGFGQVSAVFSGLAAKDPDTAFARLEQIDDLERTQAIAGIAMNGAWDPDLRERLLASAESLPPESRQQLHTTLVGQWAMSDPEESLEFIASLPEDQQGPLKQQVGMMLMMTDPARGADLRLSSVQKDEDLPATYLSIVSQWSARDPNGAGEWLNAQPQGPHLDIARAGFAHDIVGRDPVSAMEWAKTVENADQRVEAIRQVYNHWKGNDPKSADAALDASGLEADRIEEIRSIEFNEQPSLGGGAGPVWVSP